MYRDAPESQPVAISRFVLDLLDALSEAIDDPFVDLNAIVSVLSDDAAAVVPSFLGLSITMFLRQEHVSMAFIESPDAQSSISLSIGQGCPPICDIVFYAAEPDAFADLAIGIRAEVGVNAPVVLDAHLPPPDGRDQVVRIGLAEMSVIYQAVGVLIEQQGLTPAAARTMLEARSDYNGSTLSEVAQLVLDGLDTPTDPDAPGGIQQ